MRQRLPVTAMALWLALPVAARAAPCDIVGIATGSSHAFAIAADGSLWAWGLNMNGQLGIGSVPAIPPYGEMRPVEVVGLGAAVVAVDGGFFHSIAARADGTVWTWGGNDNGQLGDGTTTPSTVPIPVPGVSDIVGVAAGVDFSLALDRSGGVWSWGANGRGQLGDGTNLAHSLPARLTGLPVASAISVFGASSHVLATVPPFQLWAWGSNGAGELGIGTNLDSNVPVPVSGLGMVRSAAAGGNFTSLAILWDQSVWMWGSNNNAAIGQIITTLRSNVPLRVSASTGLRATTAGLGASHSHVVGTSGMVWGWGESQDGEMGNGTMPDYTEVPVAASGLTSPVQLAAGWSFTLARTSAGGVMSWGWGNYGELGDGATIQSSTPIAVDLSPLDAVPPDQGNVLRAVRRGSDVELTFAGAKARTWRLSRDLDPRWLSPLAVGPDVVAPGVTDSSAIPRSGDDYYRVQGVSRCSATAGP